MPSFSILEIHAVMFQLYVHLKLQASQPGYPVPLRSILWNLQKVATIQNICSVGYNWTRRLEIIIIDVPWQVKILRAHCDAIFPPPIFRSCRTTNTCSNLANLSNLCSGKIQHITGSLLKLHTINLKCQKLVRHFKIIISKIPTLFLWLFTIPASSQISN